jgi:hypothetical protein
MRTQSEKCMGSGAGSNIDTQIMKAPIAKGWQQDIHNVRPRCPGKPACAVGTDDKWISVVIFGG